MDTNLGQKLLLAASSVAKEAVLVAPFVKADTLRRILDSIPSDVTVKVVARWIPGEILAGVCDLEIYDLILSRENAELFVHQLLHAKFYRFDELILIGSANLTGKALGWAFPPNLEILEPAGDQSPRLREFETLLIESAIKVDALYRDEISRLVALLETQPPIDGSFFQAHVPSAPFTWRPSCRDPRRVWLVYSKTSQAQSRIVESAYNAAVEDLTALMIPDGLSNEEFRSVIAARLGSLPIMAELNARARMGLSDADAIQLIVTTYGSLASIYSPEEQWEILREWLLEFFPGVYRQDTHPDAFRISTIISG